MKKQSPVLYSFLLIALVSCGKDTPPDQAVSNEPAAQLFDLVRTPIGDISFPVECNAEAAPLVERGVALLHHMMYDEASFVFGMADDRDPDCAMAYWGRAMTLIHPLWPDRPTSTQLQQGLALVEKSLSLGSNSARENAYLETTRAYFEGADARSEKQRLARFSDAWKILSDAHPDDLEAQAFYSLALRATADISDKEYLTQKAAGVIAESVLAVDPKHPGAHHYIIHIYDFPDIANRALEAADNYGEMTPRVPHATHMMTHIYIRLGQWDKAIEWNSVSTETAWAMCLASGEINIHYTHASDYLAYSYLQKGDDRAAEAILNDIEQLQPPYSATNKNATAYTFAALPARYALERRDWAAAAELQPRSPSTFPWETSHDPYVAITHFSRAMALSRLGRPDDANPDIEAMESLRASVALTDPYWAEQIDIQILTAQAWQAYARGETDRALGDMQRAAALEASTEKDAVSPGEVLPSTELYGDLLLETGHFDAALEAYRLALQRTPRRYNSLYGAGMAAIAAGDDATADTYFTELLLIAGNNENQRSQTEEVRTLLDRE